jgi:hypothetical protein
MCSMIDSYLENNKKREFVSHGAPVNFLLFLIFFFLGAWICFLVGKFLGQKIFALISIRTNRKNIQS